MAESSSVKSADDHPSPSSSMEAGRERRRRTTALAWGIWALAVPVGVSAVSALDQVLRRYPSARPAWDSVSDAGFVIAVVAGGTVGAVVASRRPRHPVGWLFLAIAALIAVTAVLEKWAAYGLLGRPGEVRGAAVTAALTEPQFVFWLGLLSLVLLLTPTGRLPSRRWRPVALLAALLPPMAFLVMLLAPRQLEAPFERATNVLVIRR